MVRNAWYAAAKDGRNKWRRSDRMKPRRRAQEMVTAAKHRSKADGIPCDITIEWVMERLDRGVCEITGIPFEYVVNDMATKAMHPWSPSLDRAIPSVGYLASNTRVVVWIYNLAKNVWDDAAVLRMAKALLR